MKTKETKETTIKGYNPAATLLHYEVRGLIDELEFMKSKKTRSFIQNMSDEDIEEIATRVSEALGHDRPIPKSTVIKLK